MAGDIKMKKKQIVCLIILATLTIVTRLFGIKAEALWYGGVPCISEFYCVCFEFVGFELFEIKDKAALPLVSVYSFLKLWSPVLLIGYGIRCVVWYLRNGRR